MVAVVTPSDLSSDQFSLGGEQANEITIRQDFLASEGAGAPTAAPAATASPFYVDTSTNPRNLYHWDGAAWHLLGDGVGAGGADTNDFVNGASLTGTVLTLTGTGSAGAVVDLASISGGGTADGVVTAASLSGANVLSLTRSVGADVTVDLSALAAGSGTVTSVTGNAPLTVAGTATDPVLDIDFSTLTAADQNALVASLCANADFRECVMGIVLEAFDQTGADLSVADGTDGAGTFTFTPCP